MTLIFLDFDGVIVDSIRECYVVSKTTYFKKVGFSYEESEYEKLFYQYRGLVKPPSQYMTLHMALESYLQGKSKDIEVTFDEIDDGLSVLEKSNFEKDFFATRLDFQNDGQRWFDLNPLTKFGKTLQNKTLENYRIITTKNRHAVNSLIKFYDIRISQSYTIEDLKQWGTKGNMIQKILDESGVKKAIFIDDAVDHLDSVNDPRVDCYFADWGYGNNTNYPIYKY